MNLEPIIQSEVSQKWKNKYHTLTPILWPPHVKSWLTGKDYDAGRDRRQEEKGTTEDEMAQLHHRFDAHEFEWTPGAGDGQGGLACCNSWGRKESGTTEWLNWTDEASRHIPYKSMYGRERRSHNTLLTHTTFARLAFSLEFYTPEKSWLIWKDPDDGKDWGQEEKGMTEDEMVGWHHWLNGHEFE